MYIYTHIYIYIYIHIYMYSYIYIYIYTREACNKFPDFFCTSIYNWYKLLRILYFISIYVMRSLTNFYDFRFKGTTTGATGIHPTKA